MVICIICPYGYTLMRQHTGPPVLVAVPGDGAGSVRSAAAGARVAGVAPGEMAVFGVGGVFSGLNAENL